LVSAGEGAVLNSQISLVIQLVIATNADNSNFFGLQAGYGATNAQYSNLLVKCWFNLQLVSNSNFFGQSAGATNASYSNFLNKLGRNNKCYQSNFFGQNAGNGAISVYQTSLVRQLVAQCFCFKFFLVYSWLSSNKC
jgi:hypothetical protein